MQIEIHIPRPLLTLGLIGAFAAGALWSSGDISQATGGTGSVNAEVVQQAEQDVLRLRQEQAVLSRREDILRAELDALEAEIDGTDDPDLYLELQDTRQSLIALIQDQQRAEQEILTSLRQIWEAQGFAFQASRADHGSDYIDLEWPIAPELGISAHFDDDGYEQRFGIPHHALDIPAMQGTIVNAAADGTVVKVSDNGMGFNSLVIRHDGGFATMYGHVTEFLVREGDHVRMGDPVARSGGRPGTKGAGKMTTGAHLHFELIKNGQQVDPEMYLPEY